MCDRLTLEAVAAVELVGLDPAVGYLHELYRGRPSLALDLIEEFRPLIVDHLVISLCTSGKISPSGFTTDATGAKGCRMDRDTLRSFLAAYERRMLTAAHHRSVGHRLSYRSALTCRPATSPTSSPTAPRPTRPSAGDEHPCPTPCW